MSKLEQLLAEGTALLERSPRSAYNKEVRRNLEKHSEYVKAHPEFAYADKAKWLKGKEDALAKKAETPQERKSAGLKKKVAEKKAKKFFGSGKYINKLQHRWHQGSKRRAKLIKQGYGYKYDPESETGTTDYRWLDKPTRKEVPKPDYRPPKKFRDSDFFKPVKPRK